MVAGKDVECIADVRAVLGEGPLWVEAEQALYWVDIEDPRLFRWSGNGTTIIDLPIALCSIARRAGGGFVGAGDGGFLTIDLDPLRIESFGDPEAGVEGNRFNDGKTDRGGRFWAGTMDRSERRVSGSLYRLDADLSWRRADSGYRVTNGPAFSLDGRAMYHSDSALGRVYAFDIAADGTASSRRLFAQFEAGDGYPDGMTVDSEDCLWIAFWDGWCVRRLSPAGRILDTLKLNVQRPTSCTFGGAELDRLFITSARRGLDSEALAMQPYAGGLFMTMPGMNGVAEPFFAG